MGLYCFSDSWVSVFHASTGLGYIYRDYIKLCDPSILWTSHAVYWEAKHLFEEEGVFRLGLNVFTAPFCLSQPEIGGKNYESQYTRKSDLRGARYDAPK